MKKIYMFIVLLLFATLEISAQTYVSDVSKKGTTAAPFLSIGQGAKAASMGSAFVAIADDPSAMYWNPSGITNLSGVNVLFDHTEWFAGIKYNYVGITYSLGDYGNIGASFTSSDIGEMNVTTINEPEGTGEIFKVNDVAFSLAYALKLTDNFSIG
ncbi:MAG: PorV/PorQ family protein, partial [Syntrophomonadaceae bacterium]